MRAFCSRYTFHFNALRNYLRKLERRPKWQHIRFTYGYTFFPLERSTSKSHPCVHGGKALRLFSPHPQQRITPAHAGKSSTAKGFNGVGRDHPRACGEKRPHAEDAGGQGGSPPRMRGKASIALHSALAARITPAHAGKSSLRPRWRGPGWDHPRACGEKRFPSHPQTFRLGSPPRMRGKAGKTLSAVQYVRITPAHAGKRANAVACSRMPGDHPRACGEKNTLRKWCGSAGGSPPRMRGKVRRRRIANDKIGITPAHAGKRDCPATQATEA